MNRCCSLPPARTLLCPSCGEVGPVVGSAPVRPHRPDVFDGAWQHCQTVGCRVVYYLEAESIDADEVVARVGSKAADRPTPVCFCFAHTVDDLAADADANGGVSTIKAEIRQAVADGYCACEHLNPSTKCCLADVHRALNLNAATKVGSR